MQELNEATDKAASERLKEDPEIREALEENKKPYGEKLSATEETRRKPIWFFLLILLLAAAFYGLLRYNVFDLGVTYTPLLLNIAAGLVLVMVLLIINQIIRGFVRRRVGNPVTQYNLRRITDLVVALLIVFIAVSVISSNWYTVIVSLGLISLILGLALQNWLTSFFGWVYLLIRKPYKVGDRIKIGAITGDVIGLSYFDTTLWEFRGDYLSSDHPSGRIIRFGNNRVFNEYITNYSWPLFPYIWNELNFLVSFDSDLEYVSETIKKIVHEDMGEEMENRVELYRSILKETPVDELEVRSGASVGYKLHANGWVDVTVRFLVEPKQTGKVKGRLFGKIRDALRAEPGKVRFPHMK
ncbi:MAG: mechanosensitive ion channel family protein [Candidatus Cyclobacteriaceae bacterium M2_1C_046]